MINFFRKIRKQFADDNKPLKYLRYAIGEIVLVVIGILIALQINTWNENRKERSERDYVVHELLAEFQVNLELLRRNVDSNKGLISQMDSMLHELKSMRFPGDENKILINYRMDNFLPSEGMINSISTTDSYHYIENTDLRRMLRNWSGYVKDLQENELEFMEVRRNLDDYLSPYIRIRSQFPKEDGISVTNKLELSNRLYQSRYLRWIIIMEGEQLIKKIEEIVTLLECEI